MYAYPTTVTCVWHPPAPTDGTPTPSWHSRLISDVKSDVVSYLREYTCPSSVASTPETELALTQCRTAVSSHEVVLFTKPGCGFCERAREALRQNQHLVEGGFVVHEVVGTPKAMRAALMALTGVHLVTFPMVFVKGRFVGGAESVEGESPADPPR